MIENGVPLPPTVYPLAKGRVWAMLVGSLVFVALGIVFLVVHSTVKLTVTGAVAVPFFGFCSVIIFQRLLRDRPEMVLDDAGVDHARLGRFGWDEIAAVRIREQRVRSTSQLFIELVLHDPDAYLTRAPKLVRHTASMNARLGFGPATMATNTLLVPPGSVLDAMRRHCPGLAVQH
ncbi:STM3941 family protein [Streptomyces sp. NPDC005423]|uniref:STM3941 family protein n=1 Tax=Streptomyces sp. NPDC005423 TaxID=3155343 RepID=UPI00339EE335